MHAHRISHSTDEEKRNTCPFCRQFAPRDADQVDDYRQQRIEADDPVAMIYLGNHFHFIKHDDGGALKWWNKAAVLGNAEAHSRLAFAYHEGKMVPKDATKEKYHLEEAAIKGHALARTNLAVIEHGDGNFDRCIRHMMIAAFQGHDEALEAIRKWYAKGIVTKDKFEEALRAHQDAVDATKSEQRANVPAHMHARVF
jgi:TPR repeat protein